jgi:superfamily I DNA/RNA helicase
MSNWLVPRQDLTPEQRRIVELSKDKHRVIKGGPGSGKSIILLHRARHLADMHKISSENYHIFVYTRSLKNYIQSALDMLELSENCVSTMDSWCYTYYRKHIQDSIPRTIDGKGTDYTALRKSVYEHLYKNPKLQKQYEFVIVDEGQDLDESQLRILTMISKHVTLFYDQKQQIYTHGSDENDILNILQAGEHNYSLLSVYRCSPYIVNLAASFIENENEKEHFVNQTRVQQNEKETPLFYKAATPNDEKSRIVDALKTRLSKRERIAILFPRKKQVYGFARGFSEMGIEVEVPLKKKSEDYIGHDFSSLRPKLMPYKSVKGLTFDTVFLPVLNDNSFYNIDKEEIRKLLFVGITRAVTWVFMSSVINKPFSLIGKFNELAQQNHIRLVLNDSQFSFFGSSAEQPSPKYSEPKSVGKDDDLEDFL